MNGRPGDDPIFDIKVHKRKVFTPEIDKLILEIVELGGEERLRAQFELATPPPLDAFEADVKLLRDQLKREAKDRGWET